MYLSIAPPAPSDKPTHDEDSFPSHRYFLCPVSTAGMQAGSALFKATGQNPLERLISVSKGVSHRAHNPRARSPRPR